MNGECYQEVLEQHLHFMGFHGHTLFLQNDAPCRASMCIHGAAEFLSDWLARQQPLSEPDRELLEPHEESSEEEGHLVDPCDRGDQGAVAQELMID
jgi:hypothetical protein